MFKRLVGVIMFLAASGGCVWISISPNTAPIQWILLFVALVLAMMMLVINRKNDKIVLAKSEKCSTVISCVNMAARLFNAENGRYPTIKELEAMFWYQFGGPLPGNPFRANNGSVVLYGKETDYKTDWVYDDIEGRLLYP